MASSKVERIHQMLEAAKAEEGRLAAFKSFVRKQLEESQWVADDMAPFGLVVGDNVCMVSDGGTMLTGAVTYTGIDDDESYYIATIEYIDEEGDNDSVYLGSGERTYFVTLL